MHLSYFIHFSPQLSYPLYREFIYPAPSVFFPSTSYPLRRGFFRFAPSAFSLYCHPNFALSKYSMRFSVSFFLGELSFAFSPDAAKFLRWSPNSKRPWAPAFLSGSDARRGSVRVDECGRAPCAEAPFRVAFLRVLRGLSADFLRCAAWE